MRRNAKTDLSGGVYADEMQIKAPDWGMLFLVKGISLGQWLGNAHGEWLLAAILGWQLLLARPSFARFR